MRRFLVSPNGMRPVPLHELTHLPNSRYFSFVQTAHWPESGWQLEEMQFTSLEQLYVGEEGDRTGALTDETHRVTSLTSGEDTRSAMLYSLHSASPDTASDHARH